MRFKILTTCITLLLLVNCAIAQDWQGTWQTKYGELRLFNVGKYVVGDYGKRGLMVGEKRFDLLQGVFTNPGAKRSGYFTFQAVGSNAFRGSYRWKKDGKVTDWEGTKSSSEAPTLRNFHNLNLKPQRERSGRYTGQYDTSFGRVKLFSQDQILIGDYGAKGVIIGGWDRNNFAGHFTNNGRVGRFRFYVDAQGNFKNGEWAFFPGDMKPGWNLKKVNSVMPKLVQIVPANSSKTASVEAEQKKRPAPPPSRPKQATSTVQLPWTLNPTSQFNLPKVETMVGMQQHIQWVSQARESDVVQSLRNAGYKVENGGQLITSELDGDLAKMATTNRIRSYVAVKGQDVVIVFRGSKAKQVEKGDGSIRKTLMNGLVTDANVRAIPPAFISRHSKDAGQALLQRIHAGFNISYTRLRRRIMTALEPHAGKNVYIFGHSLGGAQATLCGLDVALNKPGHFLTQTVIVSGSPRVGNANFRRFYERHVPNIYRIEVANDPVVSIPPQLNVNNYTYIHLGRLVHITPSGVLVAPENISKRPRDWNFDYHANELYQAAVSGLWNRAKRPGFFNRLADYTNRANKAEKNLSLSQRVKETVKKRVKDKLRFWD